MKVFTMTATMLLSSVIAFAAPAVHAAAAHGIELPARTEFGLGPRTSVAGRYTATLQTQQPLRPRQLQSLLVRIEDSSGHSVDDLTITIDGGMPQHGHGLPTRPRVTRSLGNGVYEIEGVRFNMGGWWEFSLAINGSAGSDAVTFNLAL